MLCIYFTEVEVSELSAMDLHSEPVTAAAAYDLVISDDAVSPESDVSTCEPHRRGVDKDIPDVSTTLPTISATQSMENVLLDTLPMDESIDLGSESVLDHSVHSAASEAPRETVDGSVSTDQIHDEQSFAVSTDKGHVHFDDILSPSDETDIESTTATAELDGSQETSAVPGPSSDDIVTEHATGVHAEFDKIVSFAEERPSEPDDAHEVEFVEEKGLQPTESSRSLCKFFENEDNVGGTDVEGKSFFDSFTTGDEDPITPSVTPSPKILEPVSTLPPLSMPHVSLSSSLSSTTATPSPAHRISDPLLLSHRQNSVVDGSVSDVDPFSTGMFTNDVDRRHDAWIPSEATRLTLASVLTSTAGTPLSSHRTCSPHIILDEQLVCVHLSCLMYSVDH